jgi:hypothetical protein
MLSTLKRNRSEVAAPARGDSTAGLRVIQSQRETSRASADGCAPIQSSANCRMLSTPMREMAVRQPSSSGGKELGFAGQDREELEKVRLVGCARSGRSMVPSMTRGAEKVRRRAESR